MENNNENKIENIIENDKESNTDNNNEKKDNKKLFSILLIVFIVIFVLAAGTLGFRKYTQYKAEKMYEALKIEQEEAAKKAAEEEAQKVADIIDETQGSNEEVQSKVPEKSLDWATIKAENADIYGWITVDGTVIDYPILSSPEDKNTDFYLDHNLDGSYGPYPGCIYSQNVYNSTDFTDFNLVLYGHNMKNGSMFAGLHKFEDLSFFNENEYIYIYTPDKNYAYKIFAAHKTDDQLIFEKYSYATEYDKLQYIGEIMEVSDMSAHYRDGVNVTVDDQIITLSTCVSGQASQRWVVWGVLEE